MVDPITLAVGGFALYKGLKAKKAKEREREELERKRVADEEAARARRVELARTQRIREAQEAAARVRKKEADAARTLKEGLRPSYTPPSAQEVEDVKYARQYDPNSIHIAIAGISGGGKSSLINAIRGISNKDQGPIVAATGVTETTRVIGRYPISDAQPDGFMARIVLYDIPGAGTLEIRALDYFKSQGLYVFDAIIILFDNRFTQTDIAILQACETLSIPCLVVRSKSDIHIKNTLGNIPGYPNDEGDDFLRAQYIPTACDRYVKESRATVADNIAQAGLSRKDVYLVSRSVVLSMVNGQKLGKSQVVLDERALLADMSNFIPLRLRTSKYQ